MIPGTYAQKLSALKDDPIWEDLEERYGKPKIDTVLTSSVLSAIAECEWAYHLKFEKGIRSEAKSLPAMRGTMVHRAIHRVHRDRAYKDWLDVCMEEWEDVWNDPKDEDLPWSARVDDLAIKNSRDDGIAMVYNYLQDHKLRLPPLIGTEVPFRGIVKNRWGTPYRFAGTIDALRAPRESIRLDDPDDLEWIDMYDNKTDKATPDVAYLARSLQFSGYGWALAHATLLVPPELTSGHTKVREDGLVAVEIKKPPRELVWYHLSHLVPYKRAGKVKSTGKVYVKGDLRGEPIIPVERTLEDYDWFAAEACRLMAKVRMKLLTRTANKFTCGMCRLKHACLTGEARNQEDEISVADFSKILDVT